MPKASIGGLNMYYELDIMLPPRLSKALASAIPGAQLTVILEGAHALHAEKPDEYNRAVLDFLKRH